MPNVLLAFGNRIDAASVSGGSFVPTLPLANVKNELQGLVTRSSNVLTSSTQFDIDLTANYRVRTFGLIAHNMGVDDKIRIIASDETDPAFASPLFDSGWVDVWPAIYDTASLEWEDDNYWEGQPTAEDRAGYNPTFIISTPTTIAPRYVRVLADVQANLAGYWQFGRFFLGPAFQPEIGMSFGHGIKWEDPSEIEVSLSGAQHADRRGKFRVARFSTDWMTEGEAMAFAFELQRKVGITDEVIFQRDTADTIQAMRTQFMGTLRELDDISNPSLNNFATAWEIKEAR